jgi:hypothetical protein
MTRHISHQFWLSKLFGLQPNQTGRVANGQGMVQHHMFILWIKYTYVTATQVRDSDAVFSPFPPGINKWLYKVHTVQCLMESWTLEVKRKFAGLVKKRKQQSHLVTELLNALTSE